jgi:hypothetical protein
MLIHNVYADDILNNLMIVPKSQLDETILEQ